MIFFVVFGLLAVSVVSFLLFSFAFGVGSHRGCGGFASSVFLVSRRGFFCAVDSCLCLVIRACHTATALLN